MSKVKGAFIFPHPPIIVKEVGKGHETAARETISAAEEAAKRIAELRPETILVITPHGNMLSDAITINGDLILYGSFANFGAPQVKLEYNNDIELTDEILNMAEQDGLMSIALDKEMRRTYKFVDEIDHGALVPLYFVQKQYQQFKLVHVTYSMLSHEEHYRFGMAIRRAIEQLNRKTVVICSGDLSHRLTKDAPAGYSPKGAEFDAQYVDIIRSGNADKLMKMDCELAEAAGECGLRGTVILFGILDGCQPRGEILSYEGPFGVGYCVAQLHIDCKAVNMNKSEILEGYIGEKKRRLEEIRSLEDEYVTLARHSLEANIREGRLLDIPNNLPKELLQHKAGVFVSLKKHGQLRGCIGTVAPTTDSIAQEIIQNAISAGAGDPRFYPVEEEELNEIEYSVDVLMKPEPIDSREQLDVKKYGVIVRSGYRSGLLLPNLEGVDTVKEQLDIVLQKAGISKSEGYRMERFEVIRHK